MDLYLALFLQVIYVMAHLMLISMGLAIIFGMMRVINLAHGEFLMLGGYTVVVATSNGIDIWLSMLVLAPLVTGVVGVVVERCLVRFLRERMIDTLLATWGLGLLLAGLVTMIWGGHLATVAVAPLGALRIGDYTMSGYEIFLVIVACLLTLGLYVLLRHTRAGLLARGVMQDPETAAARGVPVDRIHTVTFGLGTAVTGLVGGLLAPLTGVLPTIGAIYIAKAFITVICGGPAALVGTATASGLLGAINGVTNLFIGPTMGEVALLLSAILLLRLLPRGITGRIFRWSS